ncbi:WD40/YVTN/BNR-like repeat-containing protein [Dokdonella sp.]|uniref:WD40/YVTN/BNR-like repeat-containing protein n=1 Tax=Dokdonella sp. TaxID=2291710 RepID=UPI003C431750
MKRRANTKILRSITFALAALIGYASTSAAEPGRWASLGPFGGTVNQIATYEVDPEVIYAGSNAGLFKSSDGGTHWRALGGGLPQTLYVAMLSASTIEPVVYAGGGSALYRSTNAGMTWTLLPLPLASGEYVQDLSLRHGSSVELAIATTEGMYISTDGGNTWTDRTPDLPNEFYLNVHYAADGTLFLGKFQGAGGDLETAALLKSSDGGLNWNGIHPEDSVGGDPPQPLFATNQILTSSLSAQNVFVAFGGQVIASSDGGSQWQKVAIPSSGFGCSNAADVATDPSSASGLFVACTPNGLHYSADVLASPINWTTWDESVGLGVPDSDAPGVLALSPHPGFPSVPAVLAGLNSGLMRTVNGGANWASNNNGFGFVSTRAIAPHPLDTDDASSVILAGADFGPPLSRTNDGGTHWSSPLGSFAGSTIRSIAIDLTTVDSDSGTSEAFTVYAAGRAPPYPPELQNGGIYKSVDAGESWTAIDNGIAIVGGAPSMGQVRNIVPDPHSCALPPCIPGASPLQTIYVAGSGRSGTPGTPYRSARIYKSTNAGALWIPSETGLPLDVDIGPPELGEVAGVYVVPMVIDPMTTSTLYVGTAVNWNFDMGGGVLPGIANGVFKSTDGGANWIHSSSGLPPCEGPGSSQCDVLALAINPINPQELYAGLLSYTAIEDKASIYKSIDGGANWTLSKDGVPGDSVRALVFEEDGSAVYAAISSRFNYPGGVIRSTDGGVHWNSVSIGLSISSALALQTRPHAMGSGSRLLVGTESGVWDYTTVADGDADGVPDAIENDFLGGDGNGDMIPDSTQADVATLDQSVDPDVSGLNSGPPVVTLSIVSSPGGCSQLNDTTAVAAQTLPADPHATPGSHDIHGLVRFALPDCESAVLRVRFHGASFSGDAVWRNYGPRIPGDHSSTDWYSFVSATLIDNETWELAIDASAQGNDRPDSRNILFMGGPADYRIFADGFD